MKNVVPIAFKINEMAQKRAAKSLYYINLGGKRRTERLEKQFAMENIKKVG